MTLDGNPPQKPVMQEMMKLKQRRMVNLNHHRKVTKTIILILLRLKKTGAFMDQ